MSAEKPTISPVSPFSPSSPWFSSKSVFRFCQQRRISLPFHLWDHLVQHRPEEDGTAKRQLVKTSDKPFVLLLLGLQLYFRARPIILHRKSIESDKQRKNLTFCPAEPSSPGMPGSPTSPFCPCLPGRP